MISSVERKAFQTKIYTYYYQCGRTFVWRETKDPYHILLSEIMLQQTQTSRVTKYYNNFIKAYPHLSDLAAAPQSKVLQLWQGLGYNRRALNLHKAVQQINSQFDGLVPEKKDDLVSLPGIGDATAGAILCYAFNTPTAFIETNIRTVYIHEFFPSNTTVSDNEILPLVEQTLDRINPREWFYALTDYGVFLKSTIGNISTRSKLYTKQSKFEGSNRQKRSRILKALLTTSLSLEQISSITGISSDEISKPIKELENELFIKKEKGKYRVI